MRTFVRGKLTGVLILTVLSLAGQGTFPGGDDPCSAIAAANDIPVVRKLVATGLPTETPLAAGDVNGDGKFELMTAGSGDFEGLAVRDVDGTVKFIPGMDNVAGIALPDLDNDGKKELVVGEWNLEVYPDEQKTVFVYRWNGKGYARILSLDRIGTVSRVFKLGVPGREKAGILSTDLFGYWFSVIAYDQKPVLLWRKKIPGPVIYAGEMNGKTTIICTKEKKFERSPLDGVVFGYAYAGVHQYCENPRFFTLDDEGLNEIRGFKIPYRGAVWALEIGSFREKGQRELMLGIDNKGVPGLKIYEIQGERLDEIASLDPAMDDNVILGLLKTPGYFNQGPEQALTTSGYAVYYDGKSFQQKKLDFPAWKDLANITLSPNGEIFLAVVDREKGEDETGNVHANLHSLRIK